MPEPTTKKLVRSFIGAASYVRAHIPEFSEIALPLTELTKGKRASNFKLTYEQRQAFVKIKAAWCSVEVFDGVKAQ